MAAKTRILGGLFAAAVLMVGPAHAGGIVPLPIGGGTNPDPCAQTQGGHGPGGPGNGGGAPCASGPAGCIAIGVRVDVFPNAALPGGANVELSKTQANAFSGGYGGYGYGYGHGDAHQAQANVPPTLGAGAIESRCDAQSFTQQKQYNYASGTAETARLNLNLYGYGVPVILNADVLREDGWSSAGAGANSANIVTLSGWVNGSPVGPVDASQPANTSQSFGPLGTIYLNEQFVSPPSIFNPCPTYSGDAARLVVTDPTTGSPIAQVLISWVSTSTCP